MKVEIFVRRGKRLVGLTDPGKELLPIVDRLLIDAKNIKRLAEQFSGTDSGRLTIATTHTRRAIRCRRSCRSFSKIFPKVELVLHQGGPGEIVSLLATGTADIGIATEALSSIQDFVTFPYYTWNHSAIVLDGHPLLEADTLTIEQLATWPIITYSEGVTGRAHVDAAFLRAGLTPKIVMSALDADVIKAYVEIGLGVGIVASMAFDASRDQGLRPISSEHLFEANTTSIALRRGSYLRGFACRFIELCIPGMTEAEIRRQAMAPKMWLG